MNYFCVEEYAGTLSLFKSMIHREATLDVHLHAHIMHRSEKGHLNYSLLVVVGL